MEEIVPRDKTATHRKVLAAAREEFMEYGYENASMRRIGQRCDMTAAGLYRHCKDKAGLFGELGDGVGQKEGGEPPGIRAQAVKAVGDQREKDGDIPGKQRIGLPVDLQRRLALQHTGQLHDLMDVQRKGITGHAADE